MQAFGVLYPVNKFQSNFNQTNYSLKFWQRIHQLTIKAASVSF